MTIAGSNNQEFWGENIPAISASFYYPYTFAFNSINELHVVDQLNNRIRKISNAGIVTTWAGSFGDGYRSSVISLLNYPQDVSVTPSGDILITETSGRVIRKVSNNNGIISTIAGIRGYSTYTEGGIATQTGIIPLAVKQGPTGEVFFTSAGRILKINQDNTISTFAGDGSTNAYVPDGNLANATATNNIYSLAFNSIGELIYCDIQNNRIRKVLLNGTVITIAGRGNLGIVQGSFSGDGGLAVDADIYQPFGLVITPTDDIYFADTYNARIRKIFSNGTITTIAGTGDNSGSGEGVLAIESSIALTGGLAVNSKGEVIFAEDSRIRIILLNGTMFTIAGTDLESGFSGDGGPAINAVFQGIRSLAVDSNDNIYAVDQGNNMLRKIGLICPTNYVMSGAVCIPLCGGINATDSSVCNGRGQCIDPNTCSCNSPFFGSNCEMFNCGGVAMNSASVCSSHGTCLAPEVCNCSDGYFGNSCQSFNCSGILFSSTQVCSSSGICSAPNNCACQSGYYGNNCESFNCKGIKSNDPSVCSSRGVCTAPDTCKCSGKASGTNCEILTSASSTTPTTNTTALASRSTRLSDGISFKMMSSLMILFIVVLIALII